MTCEQIYFSIKTKNAQTVEKILNRESDIEFDGINVLADLLIPGRIVFIVLGGDKPAWETGLIGIGILTKAPYDKGYKGKNFKVQVSMKLLMKHPIKREDLVPYRDTYGTIGIAPITKWEPNQALSQISEQKAFALFRAMLETDESIEEDLNNLIDAEKMKTVKGSTVMMVEIPVAYGETKYHAIEKYIESINQKDEIQNAITLRHTVFNTGYKSGYPRNRIVFGAPGTGKSFMVNDDRKKLLGESNETDYERVTFHPDYSYANFVGTYKPVPCKDEDGKDAVTYEYVPGPFMRVYVNALKNGRTADVKPYLLIIEEINRANVAAVFGDVFQLLDRGENNISEYPIQASEDIRKYLAKELGGDPEDYAKIRIPDNMFIWATMNSADQGVFPMDTAFKRRWDFTYLGIDDSDEDIRGKYVVVGSKEQQRIEWNELRKGINEFLAREKINEDKQLGPYFIARSVVVPADGGDEIDSKRFCDVFKHKVLMYLFDDAGKQKRGKLFEGSAKGQSRYSKICEAFDEQGIGIFHGDIQTRVKVQDLKTNEYDLDENDMAKSEE